MKKPINKIARNIGMQNQYLAHAVWDKQVIGEIAHGGDYHSDESWVDIESVRKYLTYKYDNFIINKESYEKYIAFLNGLQK